MTAQIINGTELAQQLLADVARRAAALTAQGRQPGLAVILVGEDPASAVYVRNKAKACEQAGIYSVVHRLPKETPERELLGLIGELNRNPRINGILVQLPLPAYID